MACMVFGSLAVVRPEFTRQRNINKSTCIPAPCTYMSNPQTGEDLSNSPICTRCSHCFLVYCHRRVLLDRKLPIALMISLVLADARGGCTNNNLHSCCTAVQMFHTGFTDVQQLSRGWLNIHVASKSYTLEQLTRDQNVQRYI